jgi:flagellar hook assembly protein FlgD
VSAAGVHQVAFRSTDVTGRREQTRTVQLTIDRTAPSLGAPEGIVPSAGQFSPNGDGLADSVSVAHALTEPGAIRLVVTPAGGGAAVRTVTIPVAAAGAGWIAWDGRADGGAFVADGDYALALIPLDRARNAGPSQAVSVTVFGSFVGLNLAPTRFYPQDGDAIAPRTQATFMLKRAATVLLTVVNRAGRTVRTIAGPYPAGPIAIAWDGRADGGAFVPQGRYRIQVVATIDGRSETHATTVQAAAFDLKTSLASAKRGRKLTLTVVSSEGLKRKTRLKLSVHQPGLAAYAVKLTKVGPLTYRATWTLKPGGRSGKLTLTVTGTDRAGGRNATSLTLRIR